MAEADMTDADNIEAERRETEMRETEMNETEHTARRLIRMLDLTNLDEACDAEAIEALCDRARTPAGPVAAVCVWPRFVRQAKALLAGSGVRVATVVNFPEGGEDTRAVVAETRAALADGADEIDLVLPWRACLEHRSGFAETQVARVRAVMPQDRLLKVILETGALIDPERIRAVADLAIAAGADFIKTSTGKTAHGASPEAVASMGEAIAEAARPVGLKVSGGVRRLEQAEGYLAMADALFLPEPASAMNFRIGASGLLDALNACVSTRK